MKFRDWLKEQPETLDKVAAAIGVTLVSLHRYARGERVPRPETVSRIEEVTGGRVKPADHYEAHKAFRAALVKPVAAE